MKSRSNLGSLLPPHFIFAPPRFNVCHCTFNRLHQEIHHRHTTVRRGCIHAFHRLFSKIQSITHFRHLASRSKAERPFPENTDMIPHPTDGFKPRGGRRWNAAPTMRLAEDMHRRGEASEGTLPKATRRARKRVRSPHRGRVATCCDRIGGRSKLRPSRHVHERDAGLRNLIGT